MGTGQQESGGPGLSIEVHGDLHLHADAGATEITASEGAKIRQSGSGFVLESRDDCHVTIPSSLPVTRLRVYGDAVVRSLVAPVNVVRIDGDLKIGEVDQAVIGEVMGDLEVEGRVGQLTAKNVHGDVTVQAAQGTVALNSVDGDVRVEGHVTSVHFANVGGDVSLRNIGGSARLDNAGGDFNVRGAAESIHCVNAGGDAQLRGSFHAVKVNNVGGDFSIDDASSLEVHNVGGTFSIRGSVQRFACHSVGGDLQASGTSMTGGLHLRVGGDAAFAIAPRAGEEYAITAGGDVACELSSDANADIVILDSEGMQELRAGAGGASVRIQAGGDVSLSGAESVDMRRHVKQGGRKMGAFKIKLPSFRMNIPIPPIPPIPPMPPMPPMPNIEQMIRDRLGAHFEIDMTDEDSGASAAAQPPQPAPSKSMTASAPQTIRFDPKPVATEEERMVILRMLAEKKITVAQAEQLLAALEGGA